MRVYQVSRQQLDTQQSAASPAPLGIGLRSGASKVELNLSVALSR